MNRMSKTIVILLSFSVMPSACLSMMEDETMEGIIPRHPLTQKVFREEAAFRAATGQNIQDILNTISAFNLKQDSWDPEKLQGKIQKRMDLDLELLGILNETIKSLKPVTEVTYPLLNNKMKEAITGARDSLIKPDSFFELLEGKVPQGYGYQSSKVTYLAPNKETIYADSKGTFLKTALFYIFRHLSRSTKQLDFETLKLTWANTSPSYHMTPLPEKFNYDSFINLDSRFSKFPYFLKGDKAWPSGYFFYAHSGYAFGGDTDNPHFPKGKPHKR